MNTQEMKKLCENHKHRYVLVTTKDGRQFDAIIESVDKENVSFAVPMGGEMHTGVPQGDQGFGYGYEGDFAGDYEGGQTRQFFPGYQTYGYPYQPFPPYGYYPPFYYRPRRFQRLILPLAALTALSILPYF
ncbi:hypothetical protein K8O68_14890 [Salipaludibacillus sp. CUR1]|uniref:hypothetical protein n=1 Tax=Salipaludibacillus sp. CUR1 TaxID=2820003 RepID=UPI001E4A180C|nr:hypothetical protein [Salipaludibacillus sp. CUR1]MCE7793710.1 hypothetical protein [Salipaludibacillus sp. CUR1]